ncbi:hypothetical protein AXYL_02077 [Achromobacter xylosoxidans A8]|uniref:Uncharacterized protein n=1 Tax=Achromobacter xylosoxidans (strain A8) TaxID=762376 RepID=E3HGS0_ACHXA|nr:hypothetical protein AXYL_02077 [Achromobacter xylosoxidans A8]
MLAGHVSLDAIRRGEVDLLDLMKLNALMDAQDAARAHASRKTQ